MVKQTNYSFLPILDKENSRQDFNKITTLLEYLKIYIKKRLQLIIQNLIKFSQERKKNPITREKFFDRIQSSPLLTMRK